MEIKEVKHMPITYTPLRYPGGKTKNYEYVKKILQVNCIDGTYVEPFAGGAGLAIKLLLNNDVNRIIINDSDYAIYSFWKCLLDYTDELCEYIQNVPVTISQWEKERHVYMNQNSYSILDIGKATIFLNRTNVSGIMKGGLIGGIKQDGKYKMDARFNRNTLITKIRNIAKEKDRITLYNKDIFDLIHFDMFNEENLFVNFDPPYVNKGGKLYMNFFNTEDHELLKEEISQIPCKWIVTYDYCDFIDSLYKDYRKSTMQLTYSTNKTKKGKELVFFSDNLLLPTSFVLE